MAIPVQQIVAGLLLTAGIGFGIYAWHDQPDDAAPAVHAPAPGTAPGPRATVPEPPAVSEQAEIAPRPHRAQQPPRVDQGIMAGAEAEVQAEAASELQPETPAEVTGLPQQIPAGDQASARSASEEPAPDPAPTGPRDAGDSRLSATLPTPATEPSAGRPAETADSSAPPPVDPAVASAPPSVGHARMEPEEEVAAAAGRQEESAVARALKSLSFDSIRRTLSSLFGHDRGGEQSAEHARASGARPSGEVAQPAGNEDVAQPAGSENAPPARSLSEESIRQALRAYTAGPEGDDVPVPGGAPESDDPETDLAALDRLKGPPPTFDIVRVGRDGRAVIAGRAVPGARVEVRAGGRVIDEVEADRRGSWASMPATTLAPGDQELTVATVGPGGETVESEQVVVVAVPEPPPPQPAPTMRGESPPPQPAELASRDDGQVQLAAVGPETASAEPLAVLLPRDGRGQGRVLQAPGRIGGDGLLALMVLDYDQQGQVRLTGEGPPGAPLRIYVDNEPAAEVAVGSGGRWSAVLADPLGPGTYSLRLDQLGPAGKPVARLETPFTRVSRPPEAGNVAVDYVIVQPGNSLWRIARRLFGRGINYVHIFDANRGQIRDPDLIYPGQVFEVPAGTGAAG